MNDSTIKVMHVDGAYMIQLPTGCWQVNGETVSNTGYKTIDVAATERPNIYRLTLVHFVSAIEPRAEGAPPLSVEEFEDEKARLEAPREWAGDHWTFPAIEDRHAYERLLDSYQQIRETKLVRSDEPVPLEIIEAPEIDIPFCEALRMVGGGDYSPLVRFDKKAFVVHVVEDEMERQGIEKKDSSQLTAKTYRLYDYRGEEVSVYSKDFGRKYPVASLVTRIEAARQIQEELSAKIRADIRTWRASIGAGFDRAAVLHGLRCLRDRVFELGVKARALDNRRGIIGGFDALIADVEAGAKEVAK